jgi:hypothetical protein
MKPVMFFAEADKMLDHLEKEGHQELAGTWTTSRCLGRGMALTNSTS